jgi:hypothetical protein
VRVLESGPVRPFRRNAWHHSTYNNWTSELGKISLDGAASAACLCGVSGERNGLIPIHAIYDGRLGGIVTDSVNFRHHHFGEKTYLRRKRNEPSNRFAGAASECLARKSVSSSRHPKLQRAHASLSFPAAASISSCGLQLRVASTCLL